MSLHLINLLTTLRKIKVNFYIFFLFLNSLIFQKNKKKLFLYSIKPWQLKSQFYYRRQIYQKKIIEENNDIKIINVDFSNSIILAILAYYLNIFYKKEKNSFSKLIKNKISKKILNLYEAILYSKWDTFLRDLHSQKIEFLPISYKSMIEYFQNFYFKIEKKKIKKIIDIARFQNITVIYTEESYEEWEDIVIFFKYNSKVINFENDFGFIKYEKNFTSNLDTRFSNFLFHKTKKLNEESLLEAEKDLNFRVNGEYDKSKSLFYTVRIDDEISNIDYKIKNFKNNAIFHFCHAFADASNKRIFSKHNFNCYYEMTLFVIEYCSKNNVPLYLKLHPTRYTYTSEQIYNRSLKKCLEMHSKKNPNFYFELIEDRFNNKNISKLKNVVAVTGRGTSSLECGYLKIPIINLYNNFQDFGFNYNLKNIDKFGDLVEKLRNREKLNLNKNYEDALKLEGVFRLISDERLFEFKTIV